MEVKDFVHKFYEPQPAHLMYAYNGGWWVMSYVKEHIFARTEPAAKEWFGRATDWKDNAERTENKLLKYWQYMGALGFYLAGAAQYLGAMFIIALFLIVQFFLLLGWVGITTGIIIVLVGFNLLYSAVYRIFVRCPNCYTQMNIPIYVCKTCGAEHSRLWPSAYGVFQHRCVHCDTKLPTLDFNGRDELAQHCVSCHTPMNKEIGQLVNVHIPVVGAPSTGKSNYIVTATDAFINNYAEAHDFSVEIPDEKAREIYQSYLARLSSGRVLDKTPEITPQAYNLAVKRPNQRIGRIIYLYDAAGEAYTLQDRTDLQTYYKYVHGLIFIIDPCAIDVYRRKHEDEIEELSDSIRPSTDDVMASYERMLQVLEVNVGLQRGKKFPHPIAVVISKTDILDLEEKIGETAAKELMARDASIRLEQDAINILVEEFLVENQMGNFVRNLYQQFSDVTFFSCSALGRLPDRENHSPYQPTRVLNPFLWLLGQTSVVPVRRERVKQIDGDNKTISDKQDNWLNGNKFYYWQSLKPRPSTMGQQTGGMQRCPRCYQIIPTGKTVHFSCFAARARYLILGLVIILMSLTAVALLLASIGGYIFINQGV